MSEFSKEIIFRYEIRVRELSYLPKREAEGKPPMRAGSWHPFTTISDAITFVAANSPYGDAWSIIRPENAPYKQDWIIEVTLQSVTLEEIFPRAWKTLMKPTWSHPEHLGVQEITAP